MEQSIDFGNHIVYVRALMARRCGHAYTTILIDFNSTLYEALTELVTRPVQGGDRVKLYDVLRVSPAWVKDNENSARNSPVLETWCLPPWLVVLLVDWHRFNHWSAVGSTGFRMFNMLMWRLLCDDALNVALPELPTEGSLLQPPSDLRDEGHGPTWVDDMASYVCDMQAEMVPAIVAASVRIICSCAQGVALCVNMTEGKTEAGASSVISNSRRKVCTFATCTSPQEHDSTTGGARPQIHGSRRRCGGDLGPNSCKERVDPAPPESCGNHAV